MYNGNWKLKKIFGSKPKKKKKKLGVSIDRIDEDLQWYSPSPTD